MKKLLDANKEPEKVGLWLSLYAWMVMSGVMFPRTLYRAACVSTINVLLILRFVWFYEHTTQFAKHDKGRFPRLASWDSVDHWGRYDAFKLVAGIKKSEVGRLFLVVTRVIPILCPREEETMVNTVRDFINRYGFRYYLLDGEGVLSFGERLERAREELCAEQGKHLDIEKRM
ncbi:hypothetical protein Cgig2_003415 [Carnegiea gigantea]|uniref:Uncharacterized protein n=1 Tax=Carnegiea gigantea TaxID=171969 RepID=A0A9Q1KAB2_9CARY|nr:hypothetical protein Cgig2_003415 [Carnegiea gigantea]